MKKFIALFAAVMMVTMGASMVAATTPNFNQNQDTDAFVDNTPPVILSGYIEVINQDGVLVWSNNPDTPVGIRATTNGGTYIWESEKLVVYVLIHDDNGESDLWQHTAQAWLSPINALITDLAIDHFTNDEQTEALFKGEKFMPSAVIWQCTHDIYITDVDKYGACATNDGLVIFEPLYINPEMSSTFYDTAGVFDFVMWSWLHAGDVNIPADGNTYIEHVYAVCDDVPVTVDFTLKIHGTDMEGGIGVSHVIPVENIEYSMDDGQTWVTLTNGEVNIGDYVTCTPIGFDFRITVPYIEMGNYAGEVGFAIFAL